MKSLILIADSGSSKTSWRFLNYSGKVYSFTTEGLNPYYKTVDEIKGIVEGLLIPQLPCMGDEVEKVFFYGAGCSVPAKCEEVKKALTACFTKAKISVEHDILEAARACCGHKKGIVCILGTGSNSCSYDGINITENIGGLGFILGDEGSGAYIGKSIVAAYLNHEMPEDLHKDFYKTYKMDRAAIDKKVYREPDFNRFLATFSLFAEKHIKNKFIRSLLESCFELFLEKHVCRYKDYKKTTVHFVGSVAFYYRDILKDLCKLKGIKTGKFIKEPVEEMVKYHG